MQENNLDDIYDITPRPTSEVNVTGMTVLSLCIPGLGQLLMSQVGKAVAMFALALVLFLMWPPLVLFLDLFSAWDAYTDSKQFNSRLLKKAEIAAQVADEHIAASTIVGQIEKLIGLTKAGLLTNEELAERKAAVIAVLETKKPLGPIEDFLTILIPLVKSGGINSDEIEKIKSILFR